MLNVIGHIVGLPLVFIGFVLASVATVFVRVGAWFMDVEFEQE